MTPTHHVVVAASVGGTKIACGAVAAGGEIVAETDAVPTPRDGDTVYGVIADEIADIASRVGRDRVAAVGVSFPECVPPHPAFAVGLPAPDKAHPVTERVEYAVRARLGREMPVAVLHDAAAAVLGEASPQGTAPGARDLTFIVWGTGVASGVVRDGALYWRDAVVGMMVAEAGALIVRAANGRYVFRPSSKWPTLARSEQSLDGRMSGPSLSRRAPDLPPTIPPKAGPDLARLNAAARAGHQEGVRFIADAGYEFGRALATYIHYWRDIRGQRFADRIVVGSGVARIGDGLEGPNGGLLLGEVRRGVADGLAGAGSSDYDTGGVTLSSLGHEREYLAFTPPW